MHSGSLQLQRDSSFQIIFKNQSKETKDGPCSEIQLQGGMKGNVSEKVALIEGLSLISFFIFFLLHSGSLDRVDFHWRSLIRVVFHWRSLIRVVFHWGSLIRVVFHWGSLIRVVFHWGLSSGCF